MIVDKGKKPKFSLNFLCIVMKNYFLILIMLILGTKWLKNVSRVLSFVE